MTSAPGHRGRESPEPPHHAGEDDPATTAGTVPPTAPGDQPWALPATGPRGVVAGGDVGIAVTGDHNTITLPRLPARRRGRTLAGDPEALSQSLRALAHAVRNQWHDETHARGLYAPAPLPVPLEVASGPLSGRTCTAVTSAQLLTTSTSRRLVITGPRASGKTTCAILLVESLLADHRPGDPVPIQLSLSSWDPETQELRAWIARTIAEDYPGVLSDAVSADDLVAGRNLLPVLDGLEEVAGGDCALALRRIGESYDSRDPLVVTCTDVALDAASTEGVALSAASVASVLPVRLEDVADYLRPQADAGENPWEVVLPALAEHPDKAAVVGSPLLVALLRTHYEHPDRDPHELLDEAAFPDGRAIREMLLDGVVRAAFTPQPGDARRSGRPKRHWPAPLPERWLRHMARRARRGQLPWWRLTEPELRVPRYPVALGVATGVLWGVVALVLAWLVWPDRRDANTVKGVVGGAFCVGVAFGVSFAAPPAVASRTWHTIQRAPGRVRRARRLVGLFVRHMLVGALAVAALVGGLWLLVYLSNHAVPSVDECRRMARRNHTDHCLMQIPGAVSPDGSQQVQVVKIKPEDTPKYHTDWHTVAAQIPLLVAGGLVAAFVVFVYGLLASGRARDTFPTPRTSLAGARVRALGTMVVQLLGLLAAGAVLMVLLQPSPGTEAFGVLVIVTAVLCTLTRSSWGRYHVMHVVLVLRGRLPLRLLDFLEDAHRTNVLRQAGSTYEFRHGMLWEYLAARPGEARDAAEDEASAEPGSEAPAPAEQAAVAEHPPDSEEVGTDGAEEAAGPRAPSVSD